TWAGRRTWTVSIATFAAWRVNSAERPTPGRPAMNAPNDTTYTVEAYNISHASENKIHDDAVAQKLGFSGGLVPGVEVYAYACHPVVRRWGRAWLERGRMECRFLKPVYDGRPAFVKAADAQGALEVTVES